MRDLLSGMNQGGQTFCPTIVCLETEQKDQKKQCTIGKFLSVACPNACLDLQEVLLVATVLCVSVSIFVSEEMRPMKFFMLDFRVVAHFSMLPVRGTHASVFLPYPL